MRWNHILLQYSILLLNTFKGMLVCVITTQPTVICQVQDAFYMLQLSEERLVIDRKKNTMHNLLYWKCTVQLPTAFLLKSALWEIQIKLVKMSDFTAGSCNLHDLDENGGWLLLSWANGRSVVCAKYLFFFFTLNPAVIPVTCFSCFSRNIRTLKSDFFFF